jgi:hypothetical protein
MTMPVVFHHLAWFVVCLVLLLAGGPSIVCAQSDRVAFYVFAHADDWQLFTNPFNDVTTPPTKIVFVHTTAAGACASDGNNPEGHLVPLYIALEEGAKAGARALADANKTDYVAPHTDSVLLKGSLSNQHSVLRYTFRNTASYFLRVPEAGNNRFCCNGSDNNIKTPCLVTLQSGSSAFPTLTAVDGSTTYQSWGDFLLTLTSLVKMEAGQAQTSSLSFNIQDPDTNANEFDNPDHYATGAAMLEVTGAFPQARVTLYCGYSLSLNPSNVLCTSDTPPIGSNCTILQNKSALLAATSLAIADSSWPSLWDPDLNPNHTDWLSRTYSRPPGGSHNYCLAPHFLSLTGTPATPFAIPLIHGFAP